MDVPAPDPRAQEQAERTATLTDVMAEVARWYAEQLNGIAGADAREYLKRRGIDAGDDAALRPRPRARQPHRP